MVGFIDDHRETFGVEPICAVLPIAPSRYYDLKARDRDPHRQPGRVRRDEALCEHIDRGWREKSRGLRRPENLEAAQARRAGRGPRYGGAPAWASRARCAGGSSR
jgi:hypothetical protein